MPADQQTIETLAKRLRDAWATRTPCDPIRDGLAEGDVDSAYAIQRTNIDRRVAQGARMVGRKIGITARAVQRQLGVDQPDYGVILDEMVHPAGAPVLPAQVMQPKIEGEIAFVLDRPLAMEKPSLAEVMSAVDYAVPAVEILTSRIRDWDINIQDTVADNASAAMIVLGPNPVPLGSFDLELCGMVIESGGEQLSVGTGAACLGNPLNAVIWLAERMVRVGLPLQAGDVIMSGALGPFVDCEGGTAYRVRIGGLGAVDVPFA